MALTAILWICAGALILLGLVGTVVPVLPGAVLVFAGIALGAWIDHFERIGPWLLAFFGALAALAWVVDFVAAALGAKRVGASRLAIVGAAVGTLAGILTGLWGLLFMPLIGAAIGEYLRRRDTLRAGKVAVATWIGLLLGGAAKIAIVLTMIGIFVFALFV